MRTESTFKDGPKAKWIEGILLLTISPFLLFPNQSIIATTIALLIVAVIWIWPLFFLRSPHVPVTPYNVALLLFCLTVLVGILVTADPELTLSKAAGIILGLSIWRYICIYFMRRDQFVWIIIGFIALGLAMTVFGFFNANWLVKATSSVPFLLDLMMNNIDQEPPMLFARLTLSIHPNQIAGQITLYLPLLISLLVSSRELRSHRIVFFMALASTVLAGLALLLTQSRSGWLGTASGIFVLAILWGLLLPPSHKRRIFWSLAGFLLLVGLTIFIQSGPARIADMWLNPPQETILGTFSTLSSRQEIWFWALSAVGDFPYTGTGLGTFRVVARRLYPINVPEAFDFAHAHNVFLQLALDVGIPGLISYGALMIISVLLAWKIARNNFQLRPIGVGILASLCAFHIYGLADTSAIGSKPTLLLWIILAMLTVANEISHKKQSQL